MTLLLLPPVGTGFEPAAARPSHAVAPPVARRRRAPVDRHPSPVFPSLRFDARHADVCCGPEHARELYGLFASHGVHCVLTGDAARGRYCLDFGETGLDDLLRIGRLFEDWS